MGEALFGIQELAQRCRFVKDTVYLCSIDFEKAFDDVGPDRMLEILESPGIDDKNLRIVYDIYWLQIAKIRVEQQFYFPISIQKLFSMRQSKMLRKVS